MVTTFHFFYFRKLSFQDLFKFLFSYPSLQRLTGLCQVHFVVLTKQASSGKLFNLSVSVSSSIQQQPMLMI